MWPALAPPVARAIMSNFAERMSTSFPLPSSPHCAPNITSTMLKIVNLFDCIVRVVWYFFNSEPGLRNLTDLGNQPGSDKEMF